MNTLEPFYFLYCINVHCHASIYNEGAKITSSLNIGSIILSHYCPACQSPLFSAKDIELEQIITEAKIKLPDKALELQRLARLN